MKNFRVLALLCALLICFTTLVACDGNNSGNTTSTTTTTTNNHTHSYSEIRANTENNTVEHVCSECGEKEIETMKEYTVTYIGGGTVQTKGEITLPGGSSHGGGNFIGWKFEDTVYTAGTTLTISEDTEIEIVYDQSGNHVHAYSKQEGSTEPDCDSVGTYNLRCSCGHTLTKTIAARGHNFSEYKVSSDGLTMTRACFVCGLVQEKAVFDVKDNGKLLAIGDSMTFGTKLSGSTQESYPKHVADVLGYEYENIALAGSEAYQWNSLLTGRPASNGSTYSNINGMTKDDITEKIASADIIVMTLGGNDINYVQYRTPQKIADALISIFDTIHNINPEATVVIANSSFFIAYNNNTPSAEFLAHMAEVANILQTTLNSEEYNGFAHYVDTSRIMSTRSYFEDVDWNIDYLHPGHSGHQAIANAILDHLNK